MDIWEAGETVSGALGTMLLRRILRLSVGGPKQKGITTYSLSSLQQRAMAGTLHGAVFNTFRRTKNQFLYFAPPFIVGYYVYTWAGERCVNHVIVKLVKLTAQERVPELKGWTCCGSRCLVLFVLGV